MQLTQLIPKSNSITKNTPQLFIANENFSYEGFPILKDSLVLNNGKGQIDVNMINFSVFQDSNAMELLGDILPPKNSLLKQLDTVSDCKKELDELDLLDIGVWHEDHFDGWNNSFDEFNYRILNSIKLFFNDVEFSSFMYSFNLETKVLTNFISSSEFSVDVNGNKIMLPKLVEVVQPTKSTEGETLYPSALRPIGNMNYFGYNLRGKLGIDKEGAVFGESADEFEAKVYEHPKFEQITMTVGSNIVLLPDGTAGIRLKDQKHKVHHFRIEKV
jgi:hypothetical protein